MAEGNGRRTDWSEYFTVDGPYRRADIGAAIVRSLGPIYHANCGAFYDKISSVLGQGLHAVVDARHTHQVDSSVLGAIMRGHVQGMNDGLEVVVVNASAAVINQCRHEGILSFIGVYGEIDNAVRVADEKNKRILEAVKHRF